ncbi:ribonuclease H-like domain-containing protein [Irpex lacteus]|nr:ribonuclease H-like domain-containing protein [Irpex lacteus]
MSTDLKEYYVRREQLIAEDRGQRPDARSNTQVVDEVSAGRRKLKERIDDGVLRFWVAAGLPPSLFDYPEWKELCALFNPSYAPLTRAAYTEHLLPTAQAYVQTAQLDYLKNQRYLTLCFDGGTTRRQDGFYDFSIVTPDGEEFCIKMADGRGVSHTGPWIKGHAVWQVMQMVGYSRLGGVAADNTGNTRWARGGIVREVKIVFNCQDPEHHIDNTHKDISAIDFFSAFITTLRKLITHFSHAAHDTVQLDNLRKEKGIGRGLVRIGNTRFATVTWAAISVQRCFECIGELVDGDQLQIDLGESLTPYFRRSSKRSREFRLMLDRYIAVTEPLAKSIECIEGASTNACDVYVFWIASIASIRDALQNEDLDFPAEVCEEICYIVNSRWREFFEKNDLYLTAFYLNPQYRQSDILRNPNQLAPPKIIIKGNDGNSSSDRVPAGIKYPQTYLKVAEFLSKTAVNEILYGDNPAFTVWASKPKDFQLELVNQFKSLTLGLFPWNTPVGPNESMLSYYRRFRGVPGADLIAELGVKIYSVRPHSMANERVASTVTWLNSARRARMHVSAIFAQVQVRQWFANERKVSIITLSHLSQITYKTMILYRKLLVGSPRQR